MPTKAKTKLGAILKKKKKNGASTEKAKYPKPPAAANVAVQQPKVSARAYGLRSTGTFARSSADAYANALYAPFSGAAIGARVPDQWAYPTSTYKSQGLMTLKSDASGNCSFYLTFNPFATLIDAAATTATTVSVVPGGAGGMKRAIGLTSSQAFYAASNYTTLAQAFSSYRVVGGGFQLRSVIPPLNASGKVIMAAVPATGFFPGPKYLDNLSAVDQAAQPHAVMAIVTGLSSNAPGNHIPSSILGLPTATFATTAELETGVISFTARPITPLAYRFKSTDTAQNTFAFGGNDAPDGVAEYASTAGVFTMREREPYGSTDIHGFEAFLITCEGLPVSANVFDLEYIFHYEGTPNLSFSTGTVTSDSIQKASVDLPGMMNVVSAVNCQKPFRLEAAVAASNNVAKVVGAGVKLISAGQSAYQLAGGGPMGGMAAGLAGLSALAGML
jgi:hypothetical protein